MAVLAWGGGARGDKGSHYALIATLRSTMKTVGEHWYNLEKWKWKSRHGRHDLEVSTLKAATKCKWKVGTMKVEHKTTHFGQSGRFSDKAAQPKSWQPRNAMHAKTQLETESRPPMSEPSPVPAAVAAR